MSVGTAQAPLPTRTGECSLLEPADLATDWDKTSSEVTEASALVIGHEQEPRTWLAKARGCTIKSQVKANQGKGNADARSLAPEGSNRPNPTDPIATRPIVLGGSCSLTTRCGAGVGKLLLSAVLKREPTHLTLRLSCHISPCQRLQQPKGASGPKSLLAPAAAPFLLPACPMEGSQDHNCGWEFPVAAIFYTALAGCCV